MITRYTLKLADGRTVNGAIQGSGGLIGGGEHNEYRVLRQIARADAGEPLGVYEPKPGHVKLYTAPTAADAGPFEYVDIRGARLVGRTVR